MQKVWKFPLVTVLRTGVEVHREIEMPVDSHVLSVVPYGSGNIGEPVVVLYAMVNTAYVDAGKTETHRFQVVGTGYDVEQGYGEDDVLEFLGTVAVPGIQEYGFFHVFEVKTDDRGGSDDI